MPVATSACRLASGTKEYWAVKMIRLSLYSFAHRTVLARTIETGESVRKASLSPAEVSLDLKHPAKLYTL